MYCLFTLTLSFYVHFCFQEGFVGNLVLGRLNRVLCILVAAQPLWPSS